MPIAQVEPQSGLLDILQVKDQFLPDAFHVAIGGQIDLGQARDSRPYPQPIQVARHLLRQHRDELRPFRSRADEPHLAPHHVPQLRQLIEVQLAEDFADRSDAGVVAVGPHGSAEAFRLVHHGADLQQREFLSVFADACLPIDARPMGG